MKSNAILVTGASSGIGRACAERLAARGFAVFAGVRSESDARALSATKGIVPLSLDVTSADSVREAADRVSRAGGGLFGLVNNAGITVAGPLEALPISSLRLQFEVNVIGQILVAQAFIPLLRESGGRIVLMSSILGRLALPFLGAYAGSKFALGALADSLSMELAPWGVAVSLVEPGNIATKIWEKTRERGLKEAAEDPKRYRELYGEELARFERYTAHAESSGIQAERVARACERALCARRPRSRYTVGWDSRLLGRLAPALAGRVRQRIVRRVVLRR